MERRTIAEIQPNLTGIRPDTGKNPRAWRFDGFEFDIRRGELTGRDGLAIPLRPKAERLLREFLARPGHLLGREQLMAAVWPDAVVTDDSLVQCIGELRHALGDRSQQLIRTVPRRGYRLEAHVEPVADVPPAGVTNRASAAVADRPTDAVETASPPTGASPAIELVARHDDSRTSRTFTGLRSRPRLSGFGLAAVATLALAGAVATRRPITLSTPGIDEQIAARHVFAVVPFAVQGDESRLRQVADRAADQIAAQLSGMQGTRSFGLARTAAPAGATPAQLARELGATYVLRGWVTAVAAEAQGIVIELQLVATSDGALVGAERFHLGAGVDARDDTAQEVMNFVHKRIEAIDVAQATRAGHQPNAAELTLLGWNEVMRRQGPADMSSARARFERALAEDPDSIIALDGLGAVYLQERATRVPLTPNQIAGAEKAIERALTLAPNDGTAALIWGNLQSLRGRPDLAIPAIEKSNRLSPGFVNGHLMLGRALLAVGRISEVQAEADRAIRLAERAGDTARASAALHLIAEAALMQHDDERALDLARRAVAERPTNPQPHAVLAAVEALTGRAEQAAAEMAIFRRLQPNATVENFDDYRRSSEPRYLAARARLYDGLRLAGLAMR